MEKMRYLSGVSTLQLDRAACVGCGRCVTVCPHGVLEMEENKARIVDRDGCMECGACAINCPPGALGVKPGVGCASAILHAWLTGGEPSCDCGGGECC